MTQELQAALFDLDGVIFDTEPQYTLFWGRQCRRYHPERPGLEHEIKGQTLDQIFDRWFSGELEAVRADVTRQLDDYERHMSYDYVPGLEDFVASLRRHGVKTAVVTSSNQPKMSCVYRQHPKLATMFDAVLTSEDFARSKPDPDCYLRAAARLDALPAHCVVFEDSFNGLRAGRAAGMAVVGLATTNPAEAIAPLSQLQTPHYLGLSYDMVAGLMK